MMDGDCQLLLSDGQAFAPLWVLGPEDPPEGGEQKLHPTAFSSSVVETLIVCTGPRVQTAPGRKMWDFEDFCSRQVC